MPQKDDLRMYISYIDDSETHQKDRVIIAAVLIRDSGVRKLENILAFLREFIVPGKPSGPLSRAQDDKRDQRDFKEFHTSDMFHGRGDFVGVTTEQAIRVIRKQAQLVSTSDASICYCSVDVTKLKLTNFGDAEAKTVGFRACLKSIEAWMKKNADNESVLAICDNMTGGRVRNGIQEGFRDLRKTILKIDHPFGVLDHFHDDMYFGDSQYCAGLQIADMCAFLVNRHLSKKPETEECFEFIESRIFDTMHEPV